MTPRRCVVLGAGTVGRLVADLLSGAGADVCLVDRAVPPGTCGTPGHRLVTADITTLAAGGGPPALLGELAAADTVVLAVPEPVALAVVRPLLELLGPRHLLVDTLSVKSRFVALAAACPRSAQILSLNPMFAPDLGLPGRPVAAVAVRDGPRARALVSLIGRLGGRVVEVGADEHDRLAATAQSLTHAAVLAVGLALIDLDADLAALVAIAPPPHQAQLALLARICAGAPEVYWDVQHANPFARSARDALGHAVRALASLIDRGDEAAFARELDRLRAFFGPRLDVYRDRCAGLFRLL